METSPIHDDEKLQFRIWHTINIPREPFRYEVPDIRCAVVCLAALAKYDLFLGDGKDKPWTTVKARADKRAKLSRHKDRDVATRLRIMFRLYNLYQLEHCPGGVPIVVTNVQGCEERTAVEGLMGVLDGTEEWVEWESEEGDDIGDIALVETIALPEEASDG